MNLFSKRGMAPVKRLKKLNADCHLGIVHPHMPGDLFKAYAAKKSKPYGTYEETDCV